MLDEEATLKAFHALDTELQRLDIGLFNAGPAASPAALALVPRLVAIGPRISFSGTMSSPLDVPASVRLADAILAISNETPGGEGNFQFCCSFNVPAGIPFFPAAYHDRDAPTSFAIGCETSALLADALPRAGGTLLGAQDALTDLFQQQMSPIQAIALELAEAHGIVYKGIDA